VKVKVKLSNDEIDLYNSYKEKIQQSRSRHEIALWAKKAEGILETGKRRYYAGLEQGDNGNMRIG